MLQTSLTLAFSPTTLLQKESLCSVRDWQTHLKTTPSIQDEQCKTCSVHRSKRRGRGRKKTKYPVKINTRRRCESTQETTSGMDQITFLCCFSHRKDFIIDLGPTQFQGSTARCPPQALHSHQVGAVPGEEVSSPRLRQKENMSSPSWVNTESSRLACQQHFWVKAFSPDRHLQQSSLPRSPNHRRATLGWLQHSGNVIPQAPGPKPSPLLPYI